MAITTRLSRKLHQALGEEAAEDLVNWMQQQDTQRAELRELNELYLARFDARMAELRREIQTGFADMRAEFRLALQTGLGSLESKLEQRTAELMKWSFVFWVGAVAAIAVLAGVLR